MIEITGIRSKNKPMEIDDTSSDTTIYVRHNIEKITEEDPVFNTEEEIYVYDETQYSFAEWYKINMEQMKNEIDKLKNEIKSIKEDKE